jgi:hypothetical protein
MWFAFVASKQVIRVRGEIHVNDILNVRLPIAVDVDDRFVERRTIARLYSWPFEDSFHRPYPAFLEFLLVQ